MEKASSAFLSIGQLQHAIINHCICVFSSTIDPAVFLFALAEQQYISDVLGLIDHGDPQIRGATAILCGAIIQAALTKTRYNIHTWLASVQSATGWCVWWR